MKNSRVLGAAFIRFSIHTTSGNAALIDRGGGLIYDSDLDITWVADATGGGDLTWYEAMDYVANFTYYDSIRNVTWTDWRLPETLVPDPSCGAEEGFGYIDCTGSELGHLYYIEDANSSGLFNISWEYYWSGTECGTDCAYVFSWFAGGQFGTNKDSIPHFASYTMAFPVRDGDVAAVPIPPALWLFGSGLLGLVGIARRKKAG